ncbi:MAG: translocation/assembly module TamB domain-containing protein [Paludibacteraceae bacterium]
MQYLNNENLVTFVIKYGFNIKKLRNIIVFTLLGIIALLVILFTSLNNRKVQNFIAHQVAVNLSEKLQTTVSIGKVDYRLFNTFKFEDLYIQDMKKDTLLFVNNAYADFDFWGFLNGKFVFNDILLDRFQGNLVIDTTGVSNLDFVIKAFQNPKKNQKSTLVDFNFKDIQITNSSFKLLNLKRPALKDQKRFDGNRMNFKNINAKITVDYLHGDSLEATIYSLSAKEKSGLTIENLHTQIRGFKTGFRFPYLTLKMPNSLLTMDSVRMDYDSIANLKDFITNVRWKARIKPSKIVLNDLAVFVPAFSGIKDPVNIQVKVNGKISSFRLRDLEVRYHNSFSLKANVDLNGVPDIEETFIYADVKNFSINKGEAQDFISKLSKRPFLLPKELSRLGTVRYQGNISGFFSNLVAFGNISTDVGSLKTDILVQLKNNMRDVLYNGTVQSNSFQLGTLLANKTLGKTAFKINTKGSKLYNRSLQGAVTGSIPEIYLNKYTYRNISLDGNYDGSGFEGSINIADPNLRADFDGMVDLTQKLPVFNFDLLVDNADLHALKLTDRYEGSQLSFRGNTNMVGNSLDNLNGFLILDSIRFVNKGKELAMNLLLFESEVNNNSKFTITSDLINGHFNGNFKYSTIFQTITSIAQNYLPALSGKNIIKRQKTDNGNNHIDIDLTINDTKLVSDVLELPFTLDGTTTVKGSVDEQSQQLDINVETPYLSFGKQKIQDIIVNLNNAGKQLNLLATGKYHFPNDYLNLSLKAAAANDSLYTQIGWQNNDSIVNAGELQASTRFFKENDLTSALINFKPTQIILFDSVWNVSPSQIAFNPDTTLDVRKFKIEKNGQYILLDGIISRKNSDILEVEMNEIDINSILSLLPNQPVIVKGNATGAVSVHSVLKHPIFESNLFVKDAHLNDALLGDLYVYTGWERKSSELLISGTVVENKDTVALANGIYSFKQDSVDITFDAEKLNLGFLQRWLGNIVQNVKGIGTGSVRMFGNTKNIGFEGNVYAEDAKLTVDFLKTTYNFSDTIHLTRKSIEMKNINIYDPERNSGLLNGIVKHDGLFKNFEYDVKINAKNILALNTKPTDNDYFYGKAYGTGSVHIYGMDEFANIDVDIASQPRTKMYISVGRASTANVNDFITFINPKDTTVLATPGKKTQSEKKVSSVNVTMNMDITPDADIQLIIDPQAGDMITANGNGNLRLEYDDRSDLKLYGTYTIAKGTYLFTLQELIRKQFKIDQGSTITWSGDPLRAQLDIRAIYPLTASLRDLMDQNILSSTGRSSVPVNTILNITDELTHPTIKFDIDLPSSDETLKMQVRNLINTEEMMNRQIMYLLLFNKFYTPDYNRTASSLASTTGSTISSFLSNTAFGQLNNWLSQFSNNFSLGVNWRSSGYGTSVSNEYEGEIMFQPNNRFVVNGNIGYRDDNLTKNKIIGDLDIEYLLTENGKYRLKAYNHTVDRYSLRAAPFIQGVGVVYKEEFNSWGELWRRYLNRTNSQNSKPDSTKIDKIKSDTTITK